MESNSRGSGTLKKISSHSTTEELGVTIYYMKTILVDAVDTFVIEGEGISRPMFELLEQYPNRKIILTNANDVQMGEFGLTDLPYELFTLKHSPDKTDPKYFEHNEAAVKSAQSVGITAYHYNSDKRDLEALKKFLDDHS